MNSRCADHSIKSNYIFVYSVTYLQNRYTNFRGIEILKCKSCVIKMSDIIALRAVLIFVKPKAYDTNTYF